MKEHIRWVRDVRRGTTGISRDLGALVHGLEAVATSEALAGREPDP